MRLLIDENILLDVLQSRKPHVYDSAGVWKLCETGQDTGFVTALSFADLVYVMRKELDPDKIEDCFMKFELVFQFVGVENADISKAVRKKWNDFEDALQSSVAERLKADYIITRNVKDFQHSKVMALTPSEYLARR